MKENIIEYKIKKLIEKHPDKVYEFAKNMYYEYGEEILDFIDEQLEGCHIRNEKIYDKATELFVNPDSTKGAKWDIDDIVTESGIDFNKTKFTEFDYAYTVNMLYSDYGDIIKNTDIIMKMAVKYLTDNDYFGDPTERAYKNAKCRIHYFKNKND